MTTAGTAVVFNCYAAHASTCSPSFYVQMGAVVSQSCMSTQLHQQQVAIPTQVDTLSPMYPPVDLNAQTESNHDTGDLMKSQLEFA